MEELTTKQLEDEINRTRERRIRWEDNRRTQLGVTNNVLMTLATGLLGFRFTLKEPNNNVELGMYFLFGSVCCAIVLTFTRLYDYRKTVNIICLKLDELEKKTDQTTAKKKLRSDTKNLGYWTWGLLIAQGISFIIGCLFIGVFF